MTTFEKVVVIVTLFLFTLTVGVQLGIYHGFDRAYQEGYAEALEQRQN